LIRCLAHVCSLLKCLDATNVPTVKFNFVALSDLENQAKDSICGSLDAYTQHSSVLFVIRRVGRREGSWACHGNRIQNKQNREHCSSYCVVNAHFAQIPKRELTLVDKSGFSVRLTIWGKQAEQFSCENNAIIAFKGLILTQFSRTFVVYGQFEYNDRQSRT
jgi:replication factor A1